MNDSASAATPASSIRFTRQLRRAGQAGRAVVAHRPAQRRQDGLDQPEGVRPGTYEVGGLARLDGGGAAQHGHGGEVVEHARQFVGQLGRNRRALEVGHAIGDRTLHAAVAQGDLAHGRVIGQAREHDLGRPLRRRPRSPPRRHRP